MAADATLAHYDRHLGETYVWMCGGMEAALRAGREEIAAWNLPAWRHDLMLDLGCGFGKHTLPLLAAGARVQAVDASPAMLEILRANLPPRAHVRIHCSDIGDALARTRLRPDAILCLGDTLTHLPDLASVERLLRLCVARVEPSGHVALAFRDYSGWAPGTERRFEVRAEGERRVDCAIAVRDDHVVVEDAVREPVQGTWTTRTHRYRKLRLAPGAVADFLERLGMHVERLPDHAGMTRLLARAA